MQPNPASKAPGSLLLSLLPTPNLSLADDQYNVYDKGLFTAQPTLSTLYRPKKDVDAEIYGGADEQLEKIVKTDRFKPDKGFGGASEKAAPRDGPLEFYEDYFGLDQFLTEVNEVRKPLRKLVLKSLREQVLNLQCEMAMKEVQVELALDLKGSTK